jgi:hypothetical protein
LLLYLDLQVLPQQYGGSAELLLVNEAVRKFQLPPWPHLPDVAGTAGGEVPHEIADMPDAAAEIGEASSTAQGKLGQQQQQQQQQQPVSAVEM